MEDRKSLIFKFLSDLFNLSLLPPSIGLQLCNITVHSSFALDNFMSNFPKWQKISHSVWNFCPL